MNKTWRFTADNGDEIVLRLSRTFTQKQFKKLKLYKSIGKQIGLHIYKKNRWLLFVRKEINNGYLL